MSQSSTLEVNKANQIEDYKEEKTENKRIRNIPLLQIEQWCIWQQCTASRTELEILYEECVEEQINQRNLWRWYFIKGTYLSANEQWCIWIRIWAHYGWGIPPKENVDQSSLPLWAIIEYCQQNCTSQTETQRVVVNDILNNRMNIVHQNIIENNNLIINSNDNDNDNDNTVEILSLKQCEDKVFKDLENMINKKKVKTINIQNQEESKIMPTDTINNIQEELHPMKNKSIQQVLAKQNSTSPHQLFQQLQKQTLYSSSDSITKNNSNNRLISFDIIKKLFCENGAEQSIVHSDSFHKILQNISKRINNYLTFEEFINQQHYRTLEREKFTQKQIEKTYTTNTIDTIIKKPYIFTKTIKSEEVQQILHKYIIDKRIDIQNLILECIPVSTTSVHIDEFLQVLNKLNIQSEIFIIENFFSFLSPNFSLYGYIDVKTLSFYILHPYRHSRMRKSSNFGRTTSHVPLGSDINNTDVSIFINNDTSNKRNYPDRKFSSSLSFGNEDTILNTKLNDNNTKKNYLNLPTIGAYPGAPTDTIFSDILNKKVQNKKINVIHFNEELNNTFDTIYKDEPISSCTNTIQNEQPSNNNFKNKVTDTITTITPIENNSIIYINDTNDTVIEKIHPTAAAIHLQKLTTANLKDTANLAGINDTQQNDDISNITASTAHLQQLTQASEIKDIANLGGIDTTITTQEENQRINADINENIISASTAHLQKLNASDFKNIANLGAIGYDEEEISPPNITAASAHLQYITAPNQDYTTNNTIKQWKEQTYKPNIHPTNKDILDDTYINDDNIKKFLEAVRIGVFASGKIREVFSTWTKGHSRLNKNEFILGIQSLQIDVPIYSNLIDVLFEKFDQRSEGVLTFGEFVRLISWGANGELS